MSFYIRKSVSVGPLRFNLSSGGVGVSVGVRGFRVGSGPRGNYIHMGRHGLYYRQTLSPQPRAARSRSTPLAPVFRAATHAPLQAIDSADAGEIQDSSSEQLLSELREKRQKLSLTPLSSALGLLLIVTAVSNECPAWGLVIIVALSTAGILFARRRDKLTKTVVIMYDFDAKAEEGFKIFCGWASELASSNRAWHIDAAGAVYDRKYHAGASQLLSRSATSIREMAPPFVTTNVPVYLIGAGRNSLFLFPDRMLVYNGKSIGAISYSSLDLRVSASRFIEDGPVPADARIVDHTWRYVNKNGGPDRRFNNNRQLPICAYEELSLRTSSGLHEILQLSRSGVCDGFAAAVRHLATVTG